MSKVDINRATKEELVKIKGIGHNKAENIIAFRQKKGKFNDIKDLKKVKGIGSKYLESIKTEVKLGDRIKIIFDPAKYNLGEVSEVHLVGEMNNWDPSNRSYALKQREDGIWEGEFYIERGTEYKFLYDSDNWDEDKHIGENGQNIII